MKIRINQITAGEEEVIVNYREMTSKIQRIICFLNENEKKIVVSSDGKQILLEPYEIFYFETVDGKNFAYAKENVYRVEATLSEIEVMLQKSGFFRCSKSMVINIKRIRSLKSLSCNRIDAMLENEEHVMISRTYASDFRKRLKGGRGDEDEE